MLERMRLALPCVVFLVWSPSVKAAPLDPEVARVEAQVALDVLERFATPYSDIGTLFTDGTGATARRVLSVAEMLAIAAVPDADVPIFTATLKKAGIEQFELVYEPVVAKGAQKQGAIRKCRLTSRALVPANDEAQHPPFFRVWTMRGGPE